MKTATKTIRPLEDRILVRRVDAEEKSKGGVFIPDTAQKTPLEGIVIEVGPGREDAVGKLWKPGVKCGDRVCFGHYTGHEVILDGEPHLIMRAGDVMGVVEEDDENSNRRAMPSSQR